MKLGFFVELKRRHVYRVAVAYAVVGWLLIEFSTQVFPVLHMPEWTQQLVVLIVLFGFPLSLVLAWAFELTPGGVRRTEPVHSPIARSREERRHAGRILDFTIIGILAVALVLALWRPWLHPHATGTAPATGVAIGAQTAANPLPRYSIAVLPFTNNSKEYDQRFFSDGLSESLIIALSQYPQLTVIGRASSFKLRRTSLDSLQIGKQLDVAYLLEGSVSHAGSKVRVRAELVETTDGRTVWSNFYDRPFDNLFVLQDDITGSVVNALEVKLLHSAPNGAIAQTDRPPSGNLHAYNAFLRGNFYSKEGTRAAMQKAIDAYQRAIDADSRYAAAYAWLSVTWTVLGSSYDQGQERERDFDLARRASETAVALDARSSVAFVARGFLNEAILKLRDARADYQHALTLEPSNLYASLGLANVRAAFGDTASAVRLARERIRRDPLKRQPYKSLVKYLIQMGKYDAAHDAIVRANSLRPTDPMVTMLAELQLLRGHAKEAVGIGSSESKEELRKWIVALASPAAGDRVGGDQALQWLIDHRASIMSYQIAQVYAFRGDADSAFHWLGRAWQLRDSGLSELLYDPMFKPYYGDPRFAEICRKLGVPVPAAKT